MSDFISRKALIKELNELWRYVNFDGDKDVFDIIMKAPAVSGGAVGYVKAERNALNTLDKHGNVCMVMRAYLRGKVNDGDLLYTTPQQPQSVSDALEEVLKILDGHIDRATTLGQQEEFREAQARIRALIKRNAEGVE